MNKHLVRKLSQQAYQKSIKYDTFEDDKEDDDEVLINRQSI